MYISESLRRFRALVAFQHKFLKYKYIKGERELRVVRRLLGNGTLAIDVGSSFGYFSKELSRHALRVIAFEPNPAVAELARSVAPANVTVINAALSSRTGTTQLRVPLNGRKRPITELATINAATRLPSGDTITVTVETRRLDDYSFGGCGFIKIDVEGHEEDVLDGAMQLIGNQRPVLMIEIEERHNSGALDRIRGRFGALSYDACFLLDRRFHPIGEFDRSIHQNFDANGDLPGGRARTPYVNNFFFMPSERAPEIVGSN